MCADLTKRKAGKADLQGWDGGATDSFRGTTSTGRSITLEDFDWVGVDVEQVFGAQNQTAIDAALAAIGTSRKAKMWLSPGTWTLTASTTIPANIVFEPAPGAVITLGAFNLTVERLSRDIGNIQWLDASGGGLLLLGDGAASGYVPQWFGVVGGTTECHTEFQYCINSAASTSSDIHVILIPDGRYAIGSTGMFIPSTADYGIAFIGYQLHGPTFVEGNTWVAGNAVFDVQGAYGDTVQHPYFENMYFYGGSGSTSWDCICIKASYAWNMLLKRIQANRCHQWLYLMKCDDLHVENCKCYGCGVIGSATGVIYQFGDPSHDYMATAWYHEVTLERNYCKAMYSYDVSSVIMSHCKIHGRVTADDDPDVSSGLYFYGGNNLMLIGDWFTHHRGGNDIYIEDSSGVGAITTRDRGSITITGCYFDGTSREMGAGTNYSVNFNTGTVYSTLVLESNQFHYNTSATSYYIGIGANVEHSTLRLGTSNSFYSTTYVINDEQTGSYGALHSIRGDFFGLCTKHDSELAATINQRQGDLRVYSLTASPSLGSGYFASFPNRSFLTARVTGGHLMAMGGIQGPITFRHKDSAASGEVLGAWNWWGGKTSVTASPQCQIKARIESIDVYSAREPSGSYAGGSYYYISVRDAAGLVSAQSVVLASTNQASRGRFYKIGSGGLYTKRGGLSVNWGASTIPYLQVCKAGTVTTTASDLAVSIWYSLRQIP